MSTTPLRRARLAVGAGVATLALAVPLAGMASATAGRDHASHDTGARGTGSGGSAGGGTSAGGGAAGRTSGNGHGPNGTARIVPRSPRAWAGNGRPGPSSDSSPHQGSDAKGSTTDPNQGAAQLTGMKRRCTNAIDRRLVHLRILGGRVGAARNLTNAHEAALAAIVTNSSAGLTSLKAAIKADTDLATLQGHCREIVSGYLVYRLVTPQVRLVIAADNAAAAATWLDKAAARIESAIAAAKAAGRDVAEAEAKLAEMRQEIAAGRAAVSGVAGPVLALRPSDAGSIAGVLGTARASLTGARAHLAKAKRAGVQAVAALRGERHPG